MLLKYHFFQNFSNTISSHFQEDLTLILDKALKVWWHYLEPFFKL